jgi:hypothetical protein
LQQRSMASDGATHEFEVMSDSENITTNTFPNGLAPIVAELAIDAPAINEREDLRAVYSLSPRPNRWPVYFAHEIEEDGVLPKGVEQDDLQTQAWRSGRKEALEKGCRSCVRISQESGSESLKDDVSQPPIGVTAKDTQRLSFLEEVSDCLTFTPMLEESQALWHDAMCLSECRCVLFSAALLHLYHLLMPVQRMG